MLQSTSFPIRTAPEFSTLQDGTSILLRKLEPTDVILHQKFLSICSSESLYQRFFRVVNKNKLTQQKVSQWTNYDPLQELAITAIQYPNSEQELGVVRLIYLEPGVAELALLVADVWQGKGLGYKLLEKAIAICQANSICCLQATVLSTNKTMLHIAKKLEFTVIRRGSESCQISRYLAKTC